MRVVIRYFVQFTSEEEEETHGFMHNVYQHMVDTLVRLMRTRKFLLYKVPCALHVNVMYVPYYIFNIR